MLYAALIVLGVVLDQVVKYLVRANLALGESLPFLPGLLELRFVKNTGAAFSIFSRHTWLLTLISLVAALALVWVMVKVVHTPWGRVPLALVLSGAVGNLIDRALFGFVTDMFATTFMNFPVFNVADIFIVVGGVLMCVYFLFFDDRVEKRKEAGHDDPSAEG